MLGRGMRRRSKRRTDPTPMPLECSDRRTVALDEGAEEGSGFFEQPHKSFLLEMPVAGERFADSTSVHEHETDGIAEGIRLVEPGMEQVENGVQVAIFVCHGT